MKYKNISNMTLTVGKNSIKPGTVFEAQHYINDSNFVRVTEPAIDKIKTTKSKDTAKK